MRNGIYGILRDKKVFRVKTQEQMKEWAAGCGRHLAADGVGDSMVITSFSGIDQNFFRSKDPGWFETKVYGGELDGEVERYSTWTKAEEGHGRMVERVREIK